ncbi:MAG TPA: alcohol dehydrogenase catalytic domain-containing protein [bacterium]|nr:alcohol dehydrogenase catalytic domain-containing protein [bacterium]
MKAAVLKSIKNLEYCDFPEPVPGKGEMVIRVRACGVCGTDVKTYRSGHRFIKYPRILGHELSGEVVAAGREVNSFSAGDRVQVAAAIPCGKCFYCLGGIQSMCENLTVVSCHYHGGFAQFMLIPENFILNGCVNSIPENLSWQEAALAEPLACVMNGQELSGIKKGETLLVVGAGPMGCFHAQAAREKGAAKVILCDTDSERLEAASFTGADRFVNPGSEDTETAIREANGGRLADHIMVVSGSAAPALHPLKLIGPRGTINLFGGFREKQFEGDIGNIQYKECRLVGSYGSFPRHNRQALSLMSAGKINGKNYISNTFPLSEIMEALAATEKRKGLKNIVIP